LLLLRKPKTSRAGEELAFVLAQRLRRLEAMREAGRGL
jgi:hypothetical protein